MEFLHTPIEKVYLPKPFVIQFLSTSLVENKVVIRKFSFKNYNIDPEKYFQKTISLRRTN